MKKIEITETRFYDKTTRGEVFEANDNTVTSKEIPWWFEPLEVGFKVAYADDGMPYKYEGDFIEPLVLNGRVVEGLSTAKLAKNKMTARYARLDQIFNAKTLGLKKLAINKPNMKDEEAINNQYRVYEEMYKNALKGWYDLSTNTAIIVANESAKQSLAELTLLLNTIKTVLDGHIASNSPSVDELLDVADVISLSKSELTPTKMSELKTTFGL